MIRGAAISTGRPAAGVASTQLTLSGSFQAGPGSGAASAGSGAVTGTSGGGCAPVARPTTQGRTTIAGASLQQ
jgi:hypothetical protein